MVSSRALKSHICEILEPREVSALSKLRISEITDHSFHLSPVMERTGTWKEEGFMHKILGPETEWLVCRRLLTSDNWGHSFREEVAGSSRRGWSHMRPCEMQSTTELQPTRQKWHQLESRAILSIFLTSHISDRIPWQDTFRVSGRITFLTFSVLMVGAGSSGAGRH